MNWINNYAQLKYFEEILGLIIYSDFHSMAGYVV